MANTTVRSGTDIAEILKLAELLGGSQYGAAHGLNTAEVRDKVKSALHEALQKIPDGLRDNVATVAQGITERASMHAAANHMAGVKEMSMDGSKLAVKEGGIISHLLSFVRTPRMPKDLFLKTSDAENLGSLAEQHGYQGAQETLKGFTGGIFEEVSLSSSQATGQAATQAASAANAAKEQAQGIKGLLGNFLNDFKGMDMTNKAAIGVSAAAAVHGASKIVQRDQTTGKRRIHFGRVLQVGVALAAGAATVYGHQRGGNAIDGGLAAGKQVVGKFTEMLANRGAAGVGVGKS